MYDDNNRNYYRRGIKCNGVLKEDEIFVVVN